MTSDTTIADLDAAPSSSGTDVGALDATHALVVAGLFAEVFEIDSSNLKITSFSWAEKCSWPQR